MILNFLPLSSTIDVSKLTVSVSSTTYNGSTQYLSNLITVSYNGVTLTNGTDYSLSGTTSSTAAGSKSATLTGLGKYKGTRTVSWSIGQRSINSTNTTISTNSLTWSGSSQTLSPTVKYSSTTLTSGTDYTISGNTGTNVNSYTLTLTGKGNYSGTKTFSWSIVARSISDCSFSYGLQYTWSGSTQTCAITVDYGSTSLVEGTDYTVSGNTGTNIGSYTATITGKGNYSGTTTINWSIVARAISNCTVTGASLTWSGSSQTCSPTVKYDSTTLTSGTDYTISGNTGTNINSYTLTLTGKGNYSGTKSVSWSIVARNISSCTASGTNSFTWSGSSQTYNPTIKYGSTTLISGTDYTISNNSKTAISSYTATITGTGNYTGTKTLSWSIVARNVSSCTMTGMTSMTWTGSQLTITPTFKYGSTVLTSGTDYTISGNTETNIGTYSLTITGIGNYTGTQTFSWTIEARDINWCSVSGTTLTWSGSSQTCTPTVTETYNNTSHTLVSGTDYTISGNTGTNINSYQLTLTGKGKYSGTKTVDWSIIARNISSCTATGTSLTWSGSSQTCSPIVKYGSTTLTSGTDYTTSGTTSATAIGSYTLTLTGIGNYTGTKSVTWTIAQRPLSTVNISSSSIPYTGYQKTADIRLFIRIISGSTTYDSYLVAGTDYTITGNTGTNAGTYTATVTGKGNFTGTRTVTWYISKASNNPTINPTSLTVYGANTTGTISITNNVSGNTITVSSGNTSIATVSKSGNTITVTPKANGSTTITVTCAGSDNYQQGTATCSVTVYMFSDSTATASDLLSGTQAYTKNGLITGTIPILGATTYNPSTSDQTISSGRYLSGKQSVRGITTNLTSNVISSRTGLFIANVLDSLDWGIITISGTYTQSSDITGATPATANKIVKGYSAWVDGSEIKGSAIINANVVTSGKTFSMSEGSTITITPYGAGRSVIGEKGVDISSSYMQGRIRIKDSGGTVIETILTGKVTFSYTKSGNTITVSAKNGSTTLATYTFTY